MLQWSDQRSYNINWKKQDLNIDPKHGVEYKRVHQTLSSHSFVAPSPPSCRTIF